MKKTAVLLLSVLLCALVFPQASLADGELRVTQETGYPILKYDRWYGYVFAKVENGGDLPISLEQGMFEIRSGDGAVLASEEKPYFGEQTLAPGEYTYLVRRLPLPAALAETAEDWQLSVLGKSSPAKTVRLACDAEYLENVQDGYYIFHFIRVSLTNDTAFALEGLQLHLALLDGEGNLLFAAEETVEGVVQPGAGTTLRVRVDPDFARYMEEHGLKPASADAVAFAEFSAGDDEI